MNKNYTLLLAGLLTGILMLAGCGGGDEDDDDDDETDFDADATGYWTGTVTPDGQAAVDGTLFVGSDGKFFITSSSSLLIGSGTTSGSSFSASATGYPPAGQTFANGSNSATFTLSGTVAAQSQINGSYSGAQQSGTLAFNYHTTRSTRTASLTAVGGNYNLAAPAGTTATLTIVNGTMNFAVSTGCSGTGTIQVADASRNYYSWSMTLAGCTLNYGTISGIGTMPEFNVLLLYSATPVGPFAVVGIK